MTSFPRFTFLLIVTVVFCMMIVSTSTTVEAIKDKGVARALRSEVMAESTCPHPGDYCETCFDCHTSGSTLTCYCADGEGAAYDGRPTSINFSSCSGTIQNDNGELVCDN